MLLFQIISGPMVWTSFVLFILGTLFQIIKLYPFIKKSTNRLNAVAYSGYILDSNSLIYRFAMLRYSLFGRYPLTMLITSLFHVLLIFLPFLVLGHNVILNSALGVSFPNLSSEFSTLFAVVVILCCFFFLIRRLTIPLVKSITTTGDYVMLFIAVSPFVTGIMAHHQIFDYTTMIHIHILSGEIMLISIPFTKFIHMIYFVINRFVVISQNLRAKALKEI